MPKFAITDTKFYVPIVTLSTQDNVKLLQQLKSCFKRSINWNGYQSKVSIETQNQYSDLGVDPNFQVVIRLFVLSFEKNAYRTSYTRYFFPIVEINNCNVTINGKYFFDQSVNNNLITYDYTTGCLLDCTYFHEQYKLIAIDFSRQQTLDAAQKAN